MRIALIAAPTVLMFAFAAASAQKEISPTYNSEPVMREVAHCPSGYQLQRWYEATTAIVLNGGDTFRVVSGYSPVTESSDTAPAHPDKCVQVDQGHGYEAMPDSEGKCPKGTVKGAYVDGPETCQKADL